MRTKAFSGDGLRGVIGGASSRHKLRNVEADQQAAAERGAGLQEFTAFHFRGDAHLVPRCALISAAR